MGADLTAGHVCAGEGSAVKKLAEQVSMTFAVFQPPAEGVDTEDIELGDLASEVADHIGEAGLTSSAGPSRFLGKVDEGVGCTCMFDGLEATQCIRLVLEEIGPRVPRAIVDKVLSGTGPLLPSERPSVRRDQCEQDRGGLQLEIRSEEGGGTLSCP
jgi:hypothetical protein